MGFGLNLNISGDFLPIVKIDARNRRILRVDRDDGGEQRLVDITDVFEGVFDLAHAEAGWAYFEDGQAPDFLMEPIGKPLPQRPSKDHRQGVRLRLMLSPKAAGSTERVREITTTAKSVMRGLEAVYEVWLAGRKHNPGMTVLVRLAGVKPVVLKGRGRSRPYTSRSLRSCVGLRSRPNSRCLPSGLFAPNGAEPRPLTQKTAARSRFRPRPQDRAGSAAEVDDWG